MNLKKRIEKEGGLISSVQVARMMGISPTAIHLYIKRGNRNIPEPLAFLGDKHRPVWVRSQFEGRD